MQPSLKYLVLKLHSLNEKQKNWILSNLSSVERNKVTRLLSEISNIKHSANRKLIVHSINEFTDTQQQSQMDTENRERIVLQKIIRKIDKSDGLVISQILDREDEWMVALILDSYQWSWSKELEKYLSYDKLKRINRLSEEFNTTLNHEVMLIVLNILMESVSAEDSLETADLNSNPIDFDEFTHFANSHEFDSNKNWWKAGHSKLPVEIERKYIGFQMILPGGSQ